MFKCEAVYIRQAHWDQNRRAKKTTDKSLSFLSKSNPQMCWSTELNCKKTRDAVCFPNNWFCCCSTFYGSLHSHGRLWDMRSNTQLLMSSCCFGSRQNHLMDFMDCIQGSQAHRPNRWVSTAKSKQDIDNNTVRLLFKRYKDRLYDILSIPHTPLIEQRK